MEELQKSIRVNKLLDIYGALLTKHQEEVLELYYQMDLSLSEISEQLGISRNGVYDAIKKATALLEKYEEKLLLLSKEEELDAFFEEVKKNKNQSELEFICYIESKVK